MMKSHRLTVATGVLSCAVLVLAACGGSSGSGSSASGVIHLTMWQQWGGGHEEAALDSAIKEYEHLHPDIQITETPVTNDAKILSAISGGNPPDIIDLGTTLELASWATEGAVTPLNSYISKSKLAMSKFVPDALKPVTVGGKVYALPFMDFTAGLLYNKKLFAAAGLNPNDPPTTLEQLTADAKKLTKTGAGGKITQLGFTPDWPGPDEGQVCPLETYGWLFGGQWYDSSTSKITPDTSANVAALSWEASYVKQYGAQNIANFLSSAGAYLTAQDPFESGKLAMVYDGPWALQYIDANVPSEASSIGVAPLPAPAGESQNTGTSFIDTNPQLVPRGAQYPQQAFDFISWLTTNAQLASTFANLVANLPQLKSVPPFSLERNTGFDFFIKNGASSHVHVWPPLATSSEYATKLCQAQNAALFGQQTPAQALSSLTNLSQ
jgi:multiple sugar transport system substrate-binding protein